MIWKFAVVAAAALGIVAVASEDAFAFGRGFSGGGVHAGGFHAGGFGGGFHGGFGGFRGANRFGGYRGGYAGARGFRGRYAGYGHWNYRHRFGGYPVYGYGDDGAAAGALIGGLALGALAATAAGY